MQLLVSKCPYCAHPVETTLDHVSEPILCTNCQRPFEMEIPTVEVTSVREVEGDFVDEGSIASEPKERTIEVAHPAVFRAHLLGTPIVLLVTGMAITGIVWSATGSVSSAVGWLGMIALLACAVTVGIWFLISFATTLTITSQRTILRRGIIQKDTSEVQHDDVRNIQVDQNILQRLLNIGALGISSSGQDDLEVVVKGMPDPEHLVEIIRKAQN